MTSNNDNMVLVKIIHPGAVKTKRGILPAPVNRIIKLDYNEACLLKAQGVSITILSKVNAEVKKNDEPKKKITRVVTPAPAKEEVKAKLPTTEEENPTPTEKEVTETSEEESVDETPAKEEVKAKLPTTEEENPTPTEEEVTETSEEESVDETPAKEEEQEETQEELTEESTNEEVEESEEVQEEAPAESESEETTEEAPSDDELTVEDVKACNNFDELKEYAAQLEINAEGLSKKKLKEAIIKALQ